MVRQAPVPGCPPALQSSTHTRLHASKHCLTLSTYHGAGQDCTMTTVRERMEDLNVQLNNLCQVCPPASSTCQAEQQCWFATNDLHHLKLQTPRVQCTMRQFAPLRVPFESQNLQPDSTVALCTQFLPQDKVSEFARLKPRDLLKATEKSINNGELWDLHERLIDRKKALNDQTHVRSWTSTVPSLCPYPGHPLMSGAGRDQCSAPIQCTQELTRHTHCAL